MYQIKQNNAKINLPRFSEKHTQHSVVVVETYLLLCLHPH